MQKEAQRRAKEEAIAQQRELNIKRRNFHQEKIRESFLCLYDENRENSNKLRNTQLLHDSMLKTMHKEAIKANQVLHII